MYQNIKSYCINLERAKDRKLSFEKLWGPILGENLEFFTAIDGRNLTSTAYLSNRELACLRSHLQCMDMALKSPFENFIFFQDDAIPQYENTMEIIYEIQQDINAEILFCCLRKKYINIIQEHDLIISYGDVSLVKGVPDNVCEGACMVFYTREGIKKYLKTFISEKYHADWFRELKNTNIYTIIPPLCDHLDDESYISNHYGRKYII